MTARLEMRGWVRGTGRVQKVPGTGTGSDNAGETGSAGAGSEDCEATLTIDGESRCYRSVYGYSHWDRELLEVALRTGSESWLFKSPAGIVLRAGTGYSVSADVAEATDEEPAMSVPPGNCKKFHGSFSISSFKLQDDDATRLERLTLNFEHTCDGKKSKGKIKFADKM